MVVVPVEHRQLREPPRYPGDAVPFREGCAAFQVGCADLPSLMKYAVMEVDHHLNAGVWKPKPRYVNSVMSEIYTLPAVAHLDEGETGQAIALVAESGVIAVGGEARSEVECEPVSLSVQLKGGLLMVAGYRSFDSLSPAMEQQLGAMEGRFIRPPVGAPHDVAYQSWHNDRVLRRLHWMPEVNELVCGQAVSVRALVNLENGLLESISVGEKYFEHTAERYGEVILSASWKMEDLFVRWSEVSALANLAPRLRRYFERGGGAPVQQPRFMPREQSRPSPQQAIIARKMPSFMAGR